MTDEELKRLEALCTKATPAPWRTVDDDEALDADILGPEGAIVSGIWEWDTGGTQKAEDREFIAAARSGLPAAIEEIRRLKALVKEAECAGGGRCPWCFELLSDDVPVLHRADCPAFTPNGEVKP